MADTLHPAPQASCLKPKPAPLLSLIHIYASPEALAARIGTWLREPEHFARMAEDMKELREKCGTPGSAQRAARALMNALEEQGSLEMF